MYKWKFMRRNDAYYDIRWCIFRQMESRFRTKLCILSVFVIKDRILISPYNFRRREQDTMKQFWSLFLKVIWNSSQTCHKLRLTGSINYPLDFFQLWAPSLRMKQICLKFHFLTSEFSYTTSERSGTHCETLCQSVPQRSNEV